MKQINRLALARQVFITLLFLSSALAPGVYGIEISASGLGNGESNSVGLNLDLSPDATLEGEIAFEGAVLIPSTAISGPVSKFEETHAVKDSTGKSASVSVNVVNAPNGLTYRSLVLPQEGTVASQPWVSAEQWLTVPKADSIKTTSSASYSTRSADVSLEEVKSSTAGDYVTLTDYYGKAYASVNQVEALQTAAGGSARSIRLYGQANDGTESLSIDTSISGLSSSAKFTSLTASASAGASAQVTQKEGIQGRFSSTAKSGIRTKTRTSNYGSQFDLNMLAQKGIAPTGWLGYYVNPSMATPSLGAIQGAVNAAQAGDTINAKEGIYKENIKIDKTLSLKGSGASRTIIDGQKSGSLFSIGKVHPNVHVYLSAMSITGGAADYGGGIANFAQLTVSDSTISGNTANYWGGGIRNCGTLIVARSTISKNTALYGGGIENNGKLTAQGNTFSGNTANHGAGIHNTGTATVIDNTFSNNNAGQGGGIENTGNLIVTGGIFTGNTAKDSGSAICNKEAGQATLKGSAIYRNNASTYGTIFNGPMGTLTVEGCNIYNNKAYFGGAIENVGSITVKDSKMTNNWAGDGGAFFNHGPATLTGCIISGNIAEDRFYYGINNPSQGGGIYNYANLTLKGCTISGNTASNGGGIWNKEGRNVALIDSKILGNTADYGGGICNEGTVDVIRSTISGNSATLYSDSYAGGIGNYHSKSILNLYSGSIDNNRARTYGGGIRNEGTLNILGSYPDITIDHNTASVGGGISNTGVVKGLSYPWEPIVHDNTPNP